MKNTQILEAIDLIANTISLMGLQLLINSRLVHQLFLQFVTSIPGSSGQKGPDATQGRKKTPPTSNRREG